MINVGDFAKCIRDNLKDRRFGKKRADEIIADFDARAKGYMKQGRSETDASLLAMKDTFTNLSDNAMEKARRTAKMLSVQASNNERIAQGLKANLKLFDVEGKVTSSRGKALARAAISLIEHDPRFSGLSYNTQKENVRAQLFAIMGDVLDNVSKGAFGAQKGKAHLPNIVKEVFGENTGDKTAQEMAKAWLKVSDVSVDLFNMAGGSMKRLQRYLPQPNASIAKLVRKEADWMKTRAERWDWERMRWPDGSPIEVADRPDVIKNIYQTLSTDGASKIDAKAFRGRGRAVGNMLDNHRFVHYKNADAWLQDLEEFGDGNVFEILSQHVETMAHKIAMVETFGPNPDMTFNNIEATVKKQAAGLSAKDKADADALLKNKFQPMLEVITRSNPMDPNSLMGAGAAATSNILTAAQLGSASLLAIPGDFMQSIAVRAINKMDLFGGMDFYFKTLATDKKFMREIAAQSGFVMDESVTATYAATRFTGSATYGPAWSRRVSDTVMRLTLMSGHTKAARWSVQAEFMGLMQRSAKDDFDKLPFKAVMERYGITKEDWDVMRKVKAWEPGKGVKFMRPIDILKTEAANKQQLFNKFQGMIFEEARTMVPEATIEGSVTLKNTTRPDTLAGLLLHSFAMYKNFPISFYMIYGRLGMTSQSVKGRLGFYAGLGAGMTMVGAIGTQMREIANGRDPMPMDSPAFIGKAFLSGGAMSIWGDFLFAGVNRFGGGPQDTAAGPLIGLLGDATELTFGDAFQWANNVGTLSEDFESKTPARLVDFAKRYTPGSNIWWARAALERQVWDRLQELADPKAYSKRQRKASKQQEAYGNEYWWPQGERSPERAPQYQGRE